MSDRTALTAFRPRLGTPRRRGVRIAPLALAAGALLLASAGPPADAGSDPLTADREAPTTPGESLAEVERTAAFATQGANSDVKLIWFTMTNCGPCQTIRPYIERMHADGLPIFKVDLNSQPDIARRFGVNSAPTFVLEVNGEEAWRSSGVPGGDGMGVAQRLRSRLTSAITASEARIAREERSRQPERLPETPRRPIDTAEVPLHLTGGAERESERGGFFDLFRRKKSTNDDPKPIDDPFAGADSGGFDDVAAADFGDAPGYADSPEFASNDFSAADAGRNDAGPRSSASGDGPPRVPSRDPMQTVARIQVFDEAGVNLGSGTVIASRPGRAIVLTCGHIFRSYQPGGRIEVETFGDGAPRLSPATLIGFDEKSDVGLLALECSEVIPASHLAPGGIAAGDRVISVGCDGGKAPTRQNHVVQRVPAVVGPNNFSCTGQPQLGRSGGGCFDAKGRLVGVVWSRSEKPPEGIYTAIEPIEALLEKHGLTALKAPSPAAASDDTLFAGAAPTDAVDGFADHDPATDDPDTAAMLDALFDEGNPGAPTPRTAAAEPAIPPTTRASSAAVADVLGRSGGAEITCIIRPLGPQGGPTRIVVINKATDRTLALLQGDAAGGAVETSLYQPAPKAPAAPVRPTRPGCGIARTRGDAPRSFCRPLVCRPRRVRR